jgi:hypothetical protein
MAAIVRGDGRHLPPQGRDPYGHSWTSPSSTTTSAPTSTGSSTACGRFERLEDVDPEIRDVIVHEHVMVVAGLGLSAEEMERNDPLGYRVHQWSSSDTGVRGRSSGVGRRKPEDEEAGRVWAAHAAEEIANWEVFLPTLYRLWRVVPEGPRHPFTDLGVTGSGRNARYRSIL